jgi:hypothetical protein
MSRKKVTSYNDLESRLAAKGKTGILHDIYFLERRDSGFSKTLAKPERVRERLVEWWNEPGTKADIGFQRPSFVLMQLLKRKLKRVV